MSPHYGKLLIADRETHMSGDIDVAVRNGILLIGVPFWLERRDHART